MANLILASERVSKNTGAQMWHVYATVDGVKVADVEGEKNEFYFYEPLKALRFAFILRKRITGAFIPKGVYNKLLAAVKAAKPAPAAEQGESAPEGEPSPLARQYSEMKAKHTDAILLFRVGDFYESFGDDAVAVSEVLGIVLTRTQAKDITERQAAFPAHALDTYLPRLVRAGKRVAICDGLPEPAPIEIITPMEQEPKKRSRKSNKKAENK